MIELILYILYGFLTLVSVTMAWKLWYAFRRFTMKQLLSEKSMIDDLPSVSVCIPARNETHAMTQCLERVIASTYPKLEIIVLDDSSGDNTSILIKSFAHAGVRFVEGSPLPEGWLGKNHALKGLLDEASGAIMLYMDVDTHIQPDTIEQLVAYMRQEDAAMVSVLPRREDGIRSSVLFATLRYYWELLLHRRSAPAVASSAWMIDRQLLIDRFDGFDRLKTDIQPEAVLASLLMKEGLYRFLIGSPMLGVSYEKKWQSQVDTSIRLLFPLLGGRIMPALAATITLTLVNMPLIAIVAVVVEGWTLVQTIALWQLSLFMALYAVFLAKTWSKGWWLGALLWPVVALQELLLIVISIIRYKSGRVSWKGRPVQMVKRTTSFRQ